MFVGGMRSFIVWIDGRQAGKVRPSFPAEFPVEPGAHTLMVTMDWLRSPPLEVAVKPGVRTELMIGGRPGIVLKMFLPMVLALFAALVLLEGVRALTPLVDESWLVRWAIILGVYVVVYVSYLLLTRNLAGDYWAMLTLGPAAQGPPGS